MVVSAFYYLNYPDDTPDDPTDAATEMYVEVGDASSSLTNFDHTLRFNVYTINYLQREFASSCLPLLSKSMIIVPTIEDKWMLQFLNENLDELILIG